MVFAQSVGPLDFWGRLVVAQFCKGLDRATVRDERSRRLLQRLVPRTAVEQTADPVFLYDLPAERADLSEEGLGPESGPYARDQRAKESGRARVGGDRRTRGRPLAQRHGIRAAFLPLGGASDAAVSTDIIRACESNPVLLPECSLEKAASILSGARVVVGMRLHSLILAARYGVPFLALAYDPKVSALCDDLAYPLSPLWSGEGHRPTDAEVDAAVDRLVRERDALSNGLLDRRDAVRAAAERNFEALGELVSDSGRPS